MPKLWKCHDRVMDILILVASWGYTSRVKSLARSLRRTSVTNSACDRQHSYFADATAGIGRHGSVEKSYVVDVT